MNDNGIPSREIGDLVDSCIQSICDNITMAELMTEILTNANDRKVTLYATSYPAGGNGVSYPQLSEALLAAIRSAKTCAVISEIFSDEEKVHYPLLIVRYDSEDQTHHNVEYHLTFARGTNGVNSRVLTGYEKVETCKQ